MELDPRLESTRAHVDCDPYYLTAWTTPRALTAVRAGPGEQIQDLDGSTPHSSWHFQDSKCGSYSHKESTFGRAAGKWTSTAGCQPRHRNLVTIGGWSLKANCLCLAVPSIVSSRPNPTLKGIGVKQAKSCSCFKNIHELSEQAGECSGYIASWTVNTGCSYSRWVCSSHRHHCPSPRSNSVDRSRICEI